MLEQLEHADRFIHWHPFTQMAEYAQSDPLLIERGEGNWLIDAHGRRWLDGVASLWCNVHGHNRPEINAAIVAQLGRIAHSTALGAGNTTTAECARRLIGVAPAGLRHVFFSEDGAEAMEIALKMAFQYWRNSGRPERNRFLTLGDAYHGDTVGAMSLGAIETFHGTFRPLLFEALSVPPPRDLTWRRDGRSAAERRAEEGRAVDRFAAAVREHKDSLAAVALESGVQGAAGIYPMPRGFLTAARELTERFDILLILDEVATGFGRTGPMFACEGEGVCPDLMALGKGLTGGYLPLAATLTTDRIYEAFLGPYERMTHFFHGHTYTGNPLACAAAIANLDIFAGEPVLERVAERAARIEAVREEFLRLPVVGDFRQRGLMVGIELVRSTPAVEPFPAAVRAGRRVCSLARRRGVALRPLGDVVVWMPPLSITEDELELLISATREAIEQFQAEVSTQNGPQMNS
ncbi:MAG: adenosylmethionine--8-amino-7-oxononanoate transaminase [Candidatus Sumerlaeia bacterium]